LALRIAISVARVSPSPPIIAMYIQEIGRMLGLPYGAATDLVRSQPRPARGREERGEVLDHADRAHAGAAAAVRDAEGLVQVEVADIGADVARRQSPTWAFMFAPSM
jgi:hypothetical protein